MIDFTTLKKEKQIMSKWKIGSKYTWGYADFLNGRVDVIELYELVGYNAELVYEDEDDRMYKVTLEMKDLSNNIIHTISQDDRYGKYALLDLKKTVVIQKEYEYLTKKVEKLKSFLESTTLS